MTMRITLIAFALLVAAVHCHDHDHDGDGSVQDVDYAKIFDVEEGDILVPKVTGKVALRRASGRFPNGVVPYTFHPRYPAQYRRTVLAAMRLIESKTCIRFVERSRERDYVQIINDRGCYSVVGRIGGQQPISLPGECQERFIAAHEIMHALGVFHEHTRPDRDQFIYIDWNNIPRQLSEQFRARGQWEVVMPRTMDFESIMLYDPYVMSRNGRPTMVSRVPGKRLLRPHEKTADLSDGDIQVIRHLYSCPANNGNPIDARREQPDVRPQPPREQPVVRPQPPREQPVARPQPPTPPRVQPPRPQPPRQSPFGDQSDSWDDFFRRVFGRRTQPQPRPAPQPQPRQVCPFGYSRFGNYCIPNLGRFM